MHIKLIVLLMLGGILSDQLRCPEECSSRRCRISTNLELSYALYCPKEVEIKAADGSVIINTINDCGYKKYSYECLNSNDN